MLIANAYEYLGLLPEQLDDMTPFEYNSLLYGYVKRKEREYKDNILIAYYTAVFNNQAKNGQLKSIHTILNNIMLNSINFFILKEYYFTIM